MKKMLKYTAFGAVAALAGTGSAMAQAATDVGTMLAGIDTAGIATDIATWGALAVGVFLAISAIPLARRLLGAVMGR